MMKCAESEGAKVVGYELLIVGHASEAAARNTKVTEAVFQRGMSALQSFNPSTMNHQRLLFFTSSHQGSLFLLAIIGN